jgi:hypothetical protein
MLIRFSAAEASFTQAIMPYTVTTSSPRRLEANATA